MRMTSLIWAALAAVLLPASLLRADTIVVGTLARENVKIMQIKGDKLIYEINGELRDADISRVTKVVVPADRTLTDAEEAFATQKWDVAVDNYQKCVKSPSKDWVKDWASLRLVEAAGKTGRFDAAVTAYLALIKKDLKLAATAKPTMPDDKSTYLATAATQVEAALRETLTPDQKKVVLQFALDIYTVQKDATKAAGIAEELIKMGGANNPSTVLSLAKFAMDAKNYPKAIAEIEKQRALFTDPANQLDALWILAEAKHALAEPLTDPAEREKAMMDSALAYMRVVTHFKDQDKDKASESLLKVAMIHESLKQTETAQNVYKQVVDEFAGTAAAGKAKAAADRIRVAPKT